MRVSHASKNIFSISDWFELRVGSLFMNIILSVILVLIVRVTIDKSFLKIISSETQMHASVKRYFYYLTLRNIYNAKLWEFIIINIGEGYVESTVLSTTFVYRTQYPICIKLLARNLPNL